MKSKDQTLKLRKLSLSVGNFIRYWGFRRIHGAIWTQLYLSKTPLSGADLTRRLGVSKALISPALDELCQYQLIKEAPSPNDKTKLFVAEDDINQVIQHVLKVREAKMLDQITNDFAKFNDVASDDESLVAERVESLGEMIISANLMLGILLNQKDILKMPLQIEKNP